MSRSGSCNAILARRIGAMAVLVATIACGGGERSGEQATNDSAAVSAVAPSTATDSLGTVGMQPGMTAALPQGAADALGAFRLAGNEPFWSVKIAADGLTYSSPQYLDGIHFKGAAPERDGEKLRWVAITAAPDAHTLDVTIEEERCQDSMADKTWTHVARVIFDGTRLEGCAERTSK